MTKRNDDNIAYFAGLMRDGRMEYRDGQVWRLWHAKWGWLREPTRSDFLGIKGYYSIYGRLEGKLIASKSHNVIWVYFNGPMPQEREINHKDGNKGNNLLCNLELVTRKQNTAHAFSMGLRRPFYGEENGSHKLSDEDVERIRLLLSSLTKSEIARRFGVSPRQIRNIANGTQRSVRVPKKPAILDGCKEIA